MPKWRVVVKETTYTVFEAEGLDEEEAYHNFTEGKSVAVDDWLGDAEVEEIYELG